MSINDDCTDEVKILLSKKRVKFNEIVPTDKNDDADRVYLELIKKIRKKHVKDYSPYEVSITNKRKPTGPNIIRTKIVFSRMGYINTKTERFDSEVYIECQWYDDGLFDTLLYAGDMLGVDNRKTLPVELQLDLVYNNLKTFRYSPAVHWYPKIYIENAIGEPKQEIKYSVEIFKKTNAHKNKYLSQYNPYTILVKEVRFVQGLFYEKLELNDFPMDLQELSVTLTSQLDNSIVRFAHNDANPSAISTKLFLAQQEWDLFNHVKTRTKTVYDSWRKYNRAQFTATAFIARRPGYYINNAYFLLFLITLLGFVPFSINLTIIFSRTLVTGVLILTSVNLRWVITQRIPSVPYLTSLDKYAIGNLCFLIAFSVWHSIISSESVHQSLKKRQEADFYALLTFAIVFILYNLSYVFWFYKKYKEIQKLKLNKS